MKTTLDTRIGEAIHRKGSRSAYCRRLVRKRASMEPCPRCRRTGGYFDTRWQACLMCDGVGYVEPKKEAS